MIKIVPVPPEHDILWVLLNLRKRDQEEIFATRKNSDAAALARDLRVMGGYRWGAYLDGAPIAMIGMVERWPGVWSMWAFGTDDWPRAIIALTRLARWTMLTTIHKAGFHRADCLALETHDDARKWLTALGAEHETTLDKWGKNGENFVVYRWTRETTQRLIDRQRRAPR